MELISFIFYAISHSSRVFQTIGEARINQIIEAAKAGSPNLIKDVVDVETEKLRREFAQDLMKQVRISLFLW